MPGYDDNRSLEGAIAHRQLFEGGRHGSDSATGDLHLALVLVEFAHVLVDTLTELVALCVVRVKVNLIRVGTGR